MADTQKSAVRLEDRRPLSPHLEIYRFTPTMAMSIAHRITGIALYAGILLVAWYLIAAASGEHAFATAAGVLGSWFGQLVLFGMSIALFTHLLGGIRHALWDTGVMMEKHEADVLAIGTAIGGLVLTGLVWIVSFIAR